MSPTEDRPLVGGDTCTNAPCTRTRRWGNPLNVKRYCEECMSAVWLTGREPVLDSHETVSDAGENRPAEPQRPEGAGRMVSSECA